MRKWLPRPRDLERERQERDGDDQQELYVFGPVAQKESKRSNIKLRKKVTW